MLAFFRKYQRIFFIIVTAVIVLSFSVFGTYYSQSAPAEAKDSLLFVSPEGKKHTKHELARMILFLGSDSIDRPELTGSLMINWLNDGVIRRDLLESGLAEMLYTAYAPLCERDLATRRERERRYAPYQHPGASFISAERLWEICAPKIATTLNRLKGSQNKELSFSERVELYLAEQGFPQTHLRETLRLQESRFRWIKPDPALASQDLALFGYHTLEDWFGPRFIALCAEFIVNAGSLAAERGYSVSKQEAWANLLRISHDSFMAQRKNPHFDASSPEDLLEKQLMSMGLTRPQATALWQQVLLFRRHFQEVSDAVVVDALSLERFGEFAQETADVDLYALSDLPPLRNYHDLQAFECYLDAIAAKSRGAAPKEALLALPTEFATIGQIKSRSPELIRRRYLVRLASVDSATLTHGIPLKEIWNWELEEEHWSELAEQFPALNASVPSNRSERFAILNDLDKQTRRQIDAIAEGSISEAHPEWVDEALDAALPSQKVISIAADGTVAPLPGVTSVAAFEKLLRTEPLGSLKATSPLYRYSDDGKTFHRIELLDRSEADEVLTFEEALSIGACDALIAHRFGKSVQEQDIAANQALKPLLTAVHELVKSAPSFSKPIPEKATGDFVAPHRLASHLMTIQKSLAESPDENRFVKASSTNHNDSLLAPQPDLCEQFKVAKSTLLVRRDSPEMPELTLAYQLAPHTWSPPLTDEASPPRFFYLKERKRLPPTSLDFASIQSTLGAEAKRALMQKVLATCLSHDSISLTGLFAADVTPESVQ